MDYPIYKGQTQLGKVQLLKEGLYYKLCCRCRSPGDQIYRLTAAVGGKQISLGILAPIGDGFGLDRRIPIKHLGEGTPEFSWPRPTAPWRAASSPSPPLSLFPTWKA